MRTWKEHALGVVTFAGFVLALVLLFILKVLPAWGLGTACSVGLLLFTALLRRVRRSDGSFEPVVNFVMRRVLFAWMGLDGLAIAALMAIPSSVDTMPLLWEVLPPAAFLVPTIIIFLYPGVTRMGS